MVTDSKCCQALWKSPCWGKADMSPSLRSGSDGSSLHKVGLEPCINMLWVATWFPSYSLERQQHNYCLDDELTKCAECVAREQRKGQANSACPLPKNQRWLLSKTMAHDCPLSARLLCGWVSPSLQLIKCSGVYQQLEAVTVGVSWVLVVLWVCLPVLYLWKHICSAAVNPVSKNKTRVLKYLLLICLVSATFELVFWTI